MTGCAPGLALIERLKATRKWAILYLHKSHNTPVLSPNIYIGIVLGFSWAQVKLWGGGGGVKEVYYGICASRELGQLSI